MEKHAKDNLGSLKLFGLKLEKFYCNFMQSNSEMLMICLKKQESSENLSSNSLINPYVNITHPEFE